MKPLIMKPLIMKPLNFLAVLLVLSPAVAGAFPSHAPASPVRAAYGLFPKIRYPKINIGKGVKAVLYPVTKTTVNGSKTVIGTGKTVIGTGRAIVTGGVVVVKGAEKGVELYQAGHALSSKTNGIPGIPHL